MNDHDDNLWSPVLRLFDLTAIGAAFLALFEHAPQIAAAMSALWMTARLWETLTRWFGRSPLLKRLPPTASLTIDKD